MDLVRLNNYAQFCMTGFFTFFATAIALYCVGLPLIHNAGLDDIVKNSIITNITNMLCIILAGGLFSICGYWYVMCKINNLKNKKEAQQEQVTTIVGERKRQNIITRTSTFMGIFFSGILGFATLFVALAIWKVQTDKTVWYYNGINTFIIISAVGFIIAIAAFAHYILEFDRVCKEEA